MVGSLIEWIEANPGWAMFIYANLNNRGASFAEPMVSVNRHYGQIVNGFFGPLIDAGRIRPLPRECWSSLIAAPIHDYARRWLRGQVRRSPSAQQQVFIAASWCIVKPE